MQTTFDPAYSKPIYKTPPASAVTRDPVRVSVGHLLSRTYTLPCSTAAQAFSQLIQPTSRFQLALEMLLPILEFNSSAELPQRILVSFILYSLYAPHPIAMNPFRSAILAAFDKEKELAAQVENAGKTSENEQLVWVLWKILRGDGADIGPYSPSSLARSPLPSSIRASDLSLDENNTVYETNPKFANEIHHVHTVDSNTTATINETQNENFANAIKLLLEGRARVLTLSEQRTVGPLIPQLTSSRMITSFDLAPLVAHNPALAHPLFVSLLLDSASTLGSGPGASWYIVSPGMNTYLDVLTHLPPTLQTFDLMGKLLRESARVGRTTVADLVRSEVLGRFISECIVWLDKAEKEERDGLISDDRFAKGVQNLCCFFNSLIKIGIIDPGSDEDSAEMAHFSLRNARFEEANMLYRAFALTKF